MRFAALTDCGLRVLMRLADTLDDAVATARHRSVKWSAMSDAMGLSGHRVAELMDQA